MNILGIAASPRQQQSSHFLLQTCLDAIRARGEQHATPINTTLIELSSCQVKGCISCGACKKSLACPQEDDFKDVIPLLSDPDLVGLILATPVYMGSMTSQAKAFLDRTVMFRRNGFLLRNKLGAGITVGGSRNGGQEITLQGIHAGMMIHDMIIVGDGDHFGGTAWNDHKSGYKEDRVGIATAQKLGQRMADLALRLHA